jgi:hypothetical protein
MRKNTKIRRRELQVKTQVKSLFKSTRIKPRITYYMITDTVIIKINNNSLLLKADSIIQLSKQTENDIKSLTITL